jgi:hypothetical protein
MMNNGIQDMAARPMVAIVSRGTAVPFQPRIQVLPMLQPMVPAIAGELAATFAELASTPAAMFILNVVGQNNYQNEDFYSAVESVIELVESHIASTNQTQGIGNVVANMCVQVANVVRAKNILGNPSLQQIVGQQGCWEAQNFVGTTGSQMSAVLQQWRARKAQQNYRAPANIGAVGVGQQQNFNPAQAVGFGSFNVTSPTYRGNTGGLGIAPGVMLNTPELDRFNEKFSDPVVPESSPAPRQQFVQAVDPAVPATPAPTEYRNVPVLSNNAGPEPDYKEAVLSQGYYPETEIIDLGNGDFTFNFNKIPEPSKENSVNRFKHATALAIVESVPHTDNTREQAMARSTVALIESANDLLKAADEPGVNPEEIEERVKASTSDKWITTESIEHAINLVRQAHAVSTGYETDCKLYQRLALTAKPVIIGSNLYHHLLDLSENVTTVEALISGLRRFNTVSAVKTNLDKKAMFEIDTYLARSLANELSIQLGIGVKMTSLIDDYQGFAEYLVKEGPLRVKAWKQNEQRFLKRFFSFFADAQTRDSFDEIPDPLIETFGVALLARRVCITTIDVLSKELGVELTGNAGNKIDSTNFPILYKLISKTCELVVDDWAITHNLIVTTDNQIFQVDRSWFNKDVMLMARKDLALIS